MGSKGGQVWEGELTGAWASLIGLKHDFYQAQDKGTKYIRGNHSTQ